jgi:hypothetical protein
MADISIGGEAPIGDISKGTYYEVSTYTIVGGTAYDSSNDAIRIDGLTRITMLSGIKYWCCKTITRRIGYSPASFYSKSFYSRDGECRCL